MEIDDMYYNKDEFVETASGNKVKLKINLIMSHNIIILGKSTNCTLWKSKYCSSWKSHCG